MDTGQVLKDGAGPAIGTAVIFGLLAYGVASLTRYSKVAPQIALTSALAGGATSLLATYVASSAFNSQLPSGTTVITPSGVTTSPSSTGLPPMVNTQTPSVNAELPA